MLESSAVPPDFRHIQTASLVGWNGDLDDPNFELLCAAVHRIVAQGARRRAREGGDEAWWTGLRLWSTPASAEAGEVTVLALVETLFAMCGYVWFSANHGTFALTIAALAAPLLLLRSPRSTARALAQWEWWLAAGRTHTVKQFFRSFRTWKDWATVSSVHGNTQA